MPPKGSNLNISIVNTPIGIPLNKFSNLKYNSNTNNTKYFYYKLTKV